MNQKKVKALRKLARLQTIGQPAVAYQMQGRTLVLADGCTKAQLKRLKKQYKQNRKNPTQTGADVWS